MLELIKTFFENLFHNTAAAEIFLRTICVLVPAEGLRIVFRAVLYSFLSKPKTKIISEQFGFITNILFGVLASFAYAEDDNMLKIWYEGFAYGFATVSIHWTWVKYKISAKLGSMVLSLARIKKK